MTGNFHAPLATQAPAFADDEIDREPDLLKPCQRSVRQEAWTRGTRRAARPAGPNWVFALGGSQTTPTHH